MARIATIARRSFLIGTAAVAGGVIIGTIAYRRDPKNPPLDDLAAGQSTLNPYVRIDNSGVTLITPRADLGQGAISVQAALLAEEMDLAWGQFKTDPGPASAVHYNGKVAAEGFPIAATSDSFMAQAGRTMGDVAAKLLGLHLTGGSSTVPDAFDKLRVAGAVARQMLLAAASAQTGMPVTELKTRDGSVLLPDGKLMSYVSLAATAASVSAPTDVGLKPSAMWRYLGKPLQRLDIVPKSTGTAQYGIDLRLPGMVYATVRSNPRRGGGISSFDAQAALQMRGVIKVVPLPDGFVSSPTTPGALSRLPTASKPPGVRHRTRPPPKPCSPPWPQPLTSRTGTAACATRAASTSNSLLRAAPWCRPNTVCPTWHMRRWSP